MTPELKKELSQDPDGLLTYEYIANNISGCDEIMKELLDNMIEVDKTGQFVVSAARYLHAIDPEHHAESIRMLTEAAIDKDRERRYLPDLLECLYGIGYADRAQELSLTDDIFRRLYKRVNPPQGL